MLTFTGTHCTYPRKDGQAELTWSHTKIANPLTTQRSAASWGKKVGQQKVPIFREIVTKKNYSAKNNCYF